jgi:23S rRNA (cytidine1920-2'-O)/16S rRNA (cytidine1409-2'-O)-methyltransferase
VSRVRLDVAMVDRGLCDSRSEAAALIEAGTVRVAGVIADKSSRMVSRAEDIVVVQPKRFVSRGGDKLLHALEHFHINVAQRSVLDAGSSTGGFTDCVLQNGARRVAAFDVGKAQLHDRLHRDDRVSVHEGVNLRHITKADLPFHCSLAVVDVSFISLEKILPVLCEVLTTEEGFPTIEMILLVKPQFEAGREEVSRGRGIITDPDIHDRVVTRIADFVGDLGCSVVGTTESPIKGADGNTEFLMYVTCQDTGGRDQS